MSFNPKPHIAYIGHTTFRQENKFWGQLVSDKVYHGMYLGRSGTGKTSALILQWMLDFQSQKSKDEQYKRASIFIDPHQDAVEKIYSLLSNEEKKTINYINATDPHNEYGFNLVRYVEPELRPLTVSGILETLKRLFGENAWGVRIEYTLHNILESLISIPGSSITDIPRILTDKQFKESVIHKLTDQHLLDFWKFYPTIPKDLTISIMNKIGALLQSPPIRRVLIDYKKEVDFREAMDTRTSILLNCGIGKTGSTASYLLAGIVFNQVILAGYSRSDIPPEQRKLFIIYADELQAYISKSVLVAIMTLRKYFVSIFISLQYLGVLPADIRQAILSNIGFLAVFRTDADSARYIAQEFPEFTIHDFVSQANHHITTKMLINGVPAKAFTSSTVEYHKNVLRDNILNTRSTKTIVPYFGKNK